MNHRSLFSLLMTVALGGLSACDRQSAQGEPPREGQDETTTTQRTPGEGPMMEEFRHTCPMMTEGAEVEVDDMPGGVALTFTTESGDVEALRERVRHMAAMYEMHQGHGRMMWHHMRGGRGEMGHGRGMGMGSEGARGPMPPAEATVEEIEGGARIILAPVDSDDLAALRERARFHQQRMSAGQCWMLQERAEG